jgi:hypothetical protein
MYKNERTLAALRGVDVSRMEIGEQRDELKKLEARIAEIGKNYARIRQND